MFSTANTVVVLARYTSQSTQFFPRVPYNTLVTLMTSVFTSGSAFAAWLAGPKIIIIQCFHVYIYISWCIPTYHVRNNYITYIVAMRPYFS